MQFLLILFLKILLNLDWLKYFDPQMGSPNEPWAYTPYPTKVAMERRYTLNISSEKGHEIFNFQI